MMFILAQTTVPDPVEYYLKLLGNYGAPLVITGFAIWVGRLLVVKFLGENGWVERVVGRHSQFLDKLETNSERLAQAQEALVLSDKTQSANFDKHQRLQRDSHDQLMTIVELAVNGLEVAAQKGGLAQDLQPHLAAIRRTILKDRMNHQQEVENERLGTSVQA